MNYQDEGQARLIRKKVSEAINLAMQGRWQEAIAANQEIIAEFPGDIGAYNRLGRAHLEKGNYPEAITAYQQGLQLDPYNSIAKKNLQRLEHLKNTSRVKETEARRVAPHHFIEEIGKAGVVSLYRLGEKETLAQMAAGDQVYLEINGNRLIVKTAYSEYLGEIEPYHALRLIRLMAGGNEYSAAVVSAGENGVRVIVREIFKHPSQAGRLSFPPRESENYQPYVDDRLVRRTLEYEDSPLADISDDDIIDDEPDVQVEE